MSAWDEIDAYLADPVEAEPAAEDGAAVESGSSSTAPPGAVQDPYAAIAQFLSAPATAWDIDYGSSTTAEPLTPEERALEERRRRAQASIANLERLTSTDPHRLGPLQGTVTDHRLQVEPREYGAGDKAAAAATGGALGVLPTIAGVAGATLAAPTAAVSGPIGPAIAGGLAATGAGWAQDKLLSAFAPETYGKAQGIMGDFPEYAYGGELAAQTAAFHPGVGTTQLGKIGVKTLGKEALTDAEKAIMGHAIVNGVVNTAVQQGIATTQGQEFEWGEMGKNLAMNMLLTDRGPVGRAGEYLGNKALNRVSPATRRLKADELEALRLSDAPLSSMGGKVAEEVKYYKDQKKAAADEQAELQERATKGVKVPKGKLATAAPEPAATEPRPVPLQFTPRWKKMVATLRKSGAKNTEDAAARILEANPDLEPYHALALALEAGFAPKKATRNIAELKKLSEQVVQVYSWGKRGVVPTAHTPAETEFREVFREGLAQRDRDILIAQERFRDAASALSVLKPEQREEFIFRAERGEAQEIPELDALSNIMHRAYDANHEAIVATGKELAYRENYLTHMLKAPDGTPPDPSVIAKLAGKAPLKGKQGFSKQRQFGETLREAFNDHGLVPVTNDAGEYFGLAIGQQQKFLMGQRVVQYLRARDMGRVVERGTKVPNGFEVVDDPAFNVGKKVLAVPTAVAEILKNHLDPGIQNSYVNVLRDFGNALNAAQLGMSAFHAGFIVNDLMATQVGVAIQNLGKGIGGASLGHLAKAAVQVAGAPFAGLQLLGPGLRKFKMEYLHPGTGGRMASDLVEGLVAGGGETKRNREYAVSYAKNFRDTFRAPGVLGKTKLLWQATLAAMERVGGPVMEHLVPNAKMLAFSKMYQHVLENKPEGFADLSPIDQHALLRKKAQEIWDNVDNRMGMVRYDNYFWPKTVKDSMFIAMRAAGWNIGGFRVLAGGAADLAATPVSREGLKNLSPAASYFLAYHAMHGVQNSFLTYLMTGKRPDEQELQDLVAADTGVKDRFGNAVRIINPDYVRDEVALSRHGKEHGPVSGAYQTVKGKLNPGLTVSMQYLENRDWKGDMIHDEELSYVDPTLKKLKQDFDWFTKNATPISVLKNEQAKVLGMTLGQRLMGAVGYNLAPSYARLEPYQALMQKFSSHNRPTGRTPDEVAKAGRRIDFRRGLDDVLKDTDADPSAYVDNAVAQGLVTEEQAHAAVLRLGLDPLEEQFKGLTADQQKLVLEAADPATIVKLQPLHEEKVDRQRLASLSLKRSTGRDLTVVEEAEYDRLKDKMGDPKRERMQRNRERKQAIRERMEAR